MARRATPQQMNFRHARGGFLLGALLGVVVGLGIALGVAFYLNKTPLPFSPRAKSDAKDSAARKPNTIAGMPQGSTQLPSFSAVTPAEKPHYDFYKILPGGEEPVTERELAARKNDAKPLPPSVRDLYFVQVGAFQNPADADNHKAQLAIIGLESNVEPTTLPDKGTWYRVRIGPFTKVEDINRVRQTLAQNGIKSNLVKAKTEKTSKVN
jgi:cell division protein FtsN